MFMIKGEVLVSLWFLEITREGLRTAVFMGVRLVLLIIGSSLLTLTTKPISLTDGIEALLSPFRRFGLPAHELAMMMTIALRFIPTLLEETDKIMKAQQARGADFESGNIINRAKALIPILVPLFISAFRIAQELAMAMEARCYGGSVKRTRMNGMKLCSRDLAVSGDIRYFPGTYSFRENFHMRQRKPKDLEKRLEKYSEQMITAPAPESVQEYFHAGRPLMLEIGCGKGQFIRKKALDNPDIDYIAIEGQDTVILRALEKAAEAAGETYGTDVMPNLRFIMAYVDHMSDFFREGSIDGIYLNFSDPWPKAHTRQAASDVQGSPDGLLPCAEAGRIHRDEDRQ